VARGKDRGGIGSQSLVGSHYTARKPYMKARHAFLAKIVRNADPEEELERERDDYRQVIEFFNRWNEDIRLFYQAE
jgi:hypothetical protein